VLLLHVPPGIELEYKAVASAQKADGPMMAAEILKTVISLTAIHPSGGTE
jgi:hypothetical protein